MHRAIRPRSPPDFYLFVYRVPGKKETAQKIARFGAHGLGRFVFDSLYEGLFQVEAFLLVLGVVAEVYVVAFLDRALVVYLSEKATYESGLTLSVLADESYFVAAFHFEVYTAQNLFRFVFYFYFMPVAVYFAVGVVEGFAYVFGAEHYFSRRAVHLELQIHRGNVVSIYFYKLGLFQPLHQALRKCGLGGFVAETFDQLFGLFDLVFLVFASGDLLFAYLLA